MPRDLLFPSQADEKRKHKLKRLIQSPNSFFMDVKCPGCFHITTVFSHAQVRGWNGSNNITESGERWGGRDRAGDAAETTAERESTRCIQLVEHQIQIYCRRRQRCILLFLGKRAVSGCCCSLNERYNAYRTALFGEKFALPSRRQIPAPPHPFVRRADIPTHSLCPPRNATSSSPFFPLSPPPCRLSCFALVAPQSLANQPAASAA